MHGFDGLMNILDALMVTVVVERVIVRLISDQAPVLVMWLIDEMVYWME